MLFNRENLYISKTNIIYFIIIAHLFKRLHVVGCFTTNFFQGMAFFSLVYYVPLYFQVVKGDSGKYLSFWENLLLNIIFINLRHQFCFSFLSHHIRFRVNSINSWCSNCLSIFRTSRITNRQIRLSYIKYDRSSIDRNWIRIDNFMGRK